jgi:hypothetical protein
MREHDVAKFRQASSHLGRKILRIERLRYDYKGRQSPEGGGVQIWLDNGMLNISVSADGETVRFEDRTWVDPFSGQLSLENEEYIASHGKWTLVDVSEEAPFSTLIGKTIEQIVPLENRFDRLIGVQIVAGDVLLNAYVYADELRVAWGLSGLRG